MQTMIVALTISMSTVGCHKSCGGHASRGACYGGYSSGYGGGHYGGYGGGHGGGYYGGPYASGYGYGSGDMRRAIPPAGRGPGASGRDSSAMPDHGR